MKNYLFLLTISPVQSFIAQARKTRDLYAGSQILSELVVCGIKEFDKIFASYGKDNKVIFPSNVTSDSLPNRFIAKVTISEDVITDIPSWLKLNGKEIEKAVTDEWIKIASETVGSNSPQGFWQQIEQHLDIHWAFEEITEEGYKTAYKNIESLIGAIKNVRPFEQYNYQIVIDHNTKKEKNIIGEQGRKCSIDGQNNALFFRKVKVDKNTKRKPNHITNDSVPKDSHLLEQGEGLSAISFVKRFYKTKTDFPSTAYISLMQDEKAIEKDDVKQCLESYKKIFSNEKEFLLECLKIKENIKFDNRNELITEFDYQFLYEDNLNEKNIPNSEQLACAEKLFPILKPYFKQKYYALILFDGDKMGKWLSGENLEEPYKTNELQKFHTRFSELLSEFGKTATKHVDKTENNGQTVYAGGDDYLGFVNLECLFEVMAKLRSKFEEIVGKPLKDEGFTDKNITFSAGIVVAAYKMPLSEVLKKAREVEKIAKNKADRNAFSISVMKSSGEIQQATFKWDEDELSSENSSNWGHLKTITNFLREEKFSNKFISSLSTELYQLAGTKLATIDDDFEQLDEAMKCEIKRLLKRAKSTSKNVSSDELQKIQDAVISLWGNAEPTVNVNKVENFIHSLHIADFLHRKLNKNYQQHEN